MTKSRVVVLAVTAVLAVSSGVGVMSIKKQETLSAEDNDIQSSQNAVYATIYDAPIQADYYDIESATAAAIDTGVLQQHESNVETGISNSVIDGRDWTIYDDEYGVGQMTTAQSAFYRALEDLSVSYISDSTLDAYYVSAYDAYVTSGVRYSDYGLSREEAVDLTEWFLYNNPQYYFYETHFLTSNTSLYIYCYPMFANGSDRASSTNDLFSVIDQWVTSINDDEVTAYDKTLSAHDLLCSNVSYVKGEYDQSIWSTVMERQSVCAGYAEAMTLMLNASGVHSTTVISETHAWNLVQMDDGNYYAVDSTWDDILCGHQLFAVGNNDIRKYDNKSEHVVIYPGTAFAPQIMDAPYKNTVIGQTELTAPQNVNVEYCDGYVRISWLPVENATGYDVKLSTSDTVYPIAGTAVRISNVPVDRNITVSVRAKADTLLSPWSDCSVYIAPETQQTVLAAPHISASAVTESAMSIQWAAVDGAQKYEYEIAGDSSFASVLAKGSTAGTGLRLSKLTAGRTYYTRVRAVADNAVSEYGVCFATTISDQAAIAAPTNFKGYFKVGNKVNLSWTKSADAYKYDVRIYSDSAMTNCIDSKTTILSSANLKTAGNRPIYAAIRGISKDGTSYSDWVTYVITD